MKIMANLKKVIKLTQGQYNTLAAGGTVGEYTGLNDEYIYLTPDNKIYATEDYVDSEIDDLASRINDSYVRYDINSQDLTNTQKSNARTNIGAGTYSKPSTGIPVGDLDSATQSTIIRASQITISATNGVSDGTSTYKYTHPSYSTQTAGLYKIGRDSTGHVTIGDAFTIPTVNNGTLTIQKNGSNVQTFTANQSSNVTANITVPTKLNDLSERYTNLLVEPASYGNTPTITTMARVDKLRANRFAGGLHPSSIICEVSTDAGATWSSAELSDNQKLWLVTNSGGNLYIPLKNGVKSCSCMARVTISGIEFNDTVKALSETARFAQMTPANWYSNRVYATVSDLYFWLNANSDRIAINVYASRGNAPDTWENAGSHPAAAGWSGMNTIHLNRDYSFGGGDTQTGNYWFIRITFRTCASDGSFDDSKLSTSATTSRQSIMNIMGYGASCWGSLLPMGNIDRPYTYAGNNGTYGHEIFRWNGDITPSSTNNFACGTTSMQWAIICGRELYENGAKLENKYLGKTAKAADSDLLDGQDSTYYLNYNNLTNKPTITDTKNTAGSTNDTNLLYLIGAKTQDANPQTYSRNNTFINANGVLVNATGFSSYSAGRSSYASLNIGTNAVNYYSGSGPASFKATSSTHGSWQISDNTGNIYLQKTNGSASSGTAYLLFPNVGTSTAPKTLATTDDAAKVVSAEFVESGYSGNILSSLTMAQNAGPIIYIKFGSAPTSSSDYDAMLSNTNGATIQGISSFSDQEVAYIWASNNDGNVIYNNQTTSLNYQQQAGGVSIKLYYTYDNPCVLTLTTNGDITLQTFYSGGGGSDD